MLAKYHKLAIQKRSFYLDESSDEELNVRTYLYSSNAKGSSRRSIELCDMTETATAVAIDEIKLDGMLIC